MAMLPALTPTNFAEAMQFAEALAKSTMVPPAFQRSPANILVAIQWGAELGLGPLQALQNIAVINGRPAVYGDAMLGLVRGSPYCEDVIERIEGEGDNRAAVCEAQRKGAAPVIRSFSVADAKRAGLWGKSGPWQQYPMRMLQMRARGFALRDAFPDVLRGVIAAEEASDEPLDVTPAPVALTAELDAFAEDVVVDQAEEDPLLSAARETALAGRDTFRGWYLNLDDDQRTSLRPHMRSLQDTARQSSRVEEFPLSPEPPEESTSSSAPPPGEVRRRRPRRPRDEPTEDEIERSLNKIAAVLGPEEIAELDPAPIEEPPDYVRIPSGDPPVLVLFNVEGGNPQEWFGRARERLREMAAARLAADRFTAFRKANFAPLLRLQKEIHSYWRQLDELIAEGERSSHANSVGERS